MGGGLYQVDAMPGGLRAIETEYRGFRFRSRTEARYAVLFDAAGINWQYEAEGFHLNGARYLPDFFLPELKTYVEVKPTREAAEQAVPLLLALKEASGCDAMFGIGSPTIGPPDNFFRCAKLSEGIHVYRAAPAQCPFCNRLVFDRRDLCRCTGDVKVLRWPSCPPSLSYALGEAQRARFEHGETGKPRPHTPLPPTHRIIRVYAAGAIFRRGSELEPWRADVFNCNDTGPATGPGRRFVYAGPTIRDDHGLAFEGLADECLAEVAGADAVFAWIDRKETIGTLVEIGAAYAARKPVFVAFTRPDLTELFYFVKQLATVAVITDVIAAWNLFTRWQTGA